MTADPTAPPPPYSPFLSFAEWSAQVIVPSSFGAFEQLLTAIRTRTEASLLDRARDRLTTYAGIETGALEGLYEAGRGFTMTIAEHASVLQAIQHERGEAVARAVEDQTDAFNLTFDMSTRRAPITELFVRQLHEANCRHQSTYLAYTEVGPQDRNLIAGQYKTEPNNPYRPDGDLAHSYASVIDVAPEMSRLISELQTDEFDEAHPVLQASYAHYAFVSIHPFPDGNGRVARSLASVFTYRRPGVPLLIFGDEKVDYLRSLEAADAGSFQPFVDFISERLIGCIQLVQEFLQDADSPTDDQAVNRVQATLSAGFGNLTHPEADALASLLLDIAVKSVTEWVTSHPDLNGVHVSATTTSSTLPAGRAPGGYRPVVSHPRHISLNIGVAPPANAHIQVLVAALVSTAAGQMYDFQLVAVKPNDGSAFVPPMGVRLPEIKPHQTVALQTRLSGWMRRLINTALEETTRAAETNLRAQGYRK